MKPWVASILAMAMALGMSAEAVTSDRTLGNLQAAYLGEISARATYEGYARKAQAEGFLGVAALFRASALSEGVHAAAHATVIRKMGAVPRTDTKVAGPLSTKENLEQAIKAEGFEEASLYPAFIRVAREEGHKAALQSFTFAKNAEREHSSLFLGALAGLETWRAGKSFLVCTQCGYTLPKISLEKCPFCLGSRGRMVTVQ